MTETGGHARRGISLRKVERMAVLAFKNALRLHDDSIRLFSHRSYPSAYALSVFAAEEIGKYMLLEHTVWSGRVNGRPTPEEEHEWLTLMLDHRVKQGQFARHAEFFVLSTPLVRRIWNGELERRKHCALYVGLPTARRRINVRGRIISPHRVGRRAAIEQITTVNDFLVTYAGGVAFENMIADLSSMEPLLTLRLANRLIRRWPWMGRHAHRYLDRLEQSDRESGS
jgi:AbiV family abortive infection protein